MWTFIYYDLMSFYETMTDEIVDGRSFNISSSESQDFIIISIRMKDELHVIKLKPFEDCQDIWAWYDVTFDMLLDFLHFMKVNISNGNYWNSEFSQMPGFPFDPIKQDKSALFELVNKGRML